VIVFSTSGDPALELVHPVNNDLDLNFFGTACAFNPPEQISQKWGQIGQHGQQIKKTGTGGQSGMVHGFIDAISEVQLNTGMQFIMTAVRDAEPGTLLLGTGVSVANGILTKVMFTRMWAYSTRFCADFMLTWEAP